jgi:ubiquinone/menaquinone biosynthesis C-methylase UbiE
MPETLNKKHWYDGWFYAKTVNPFLKEFNDIISNFVENNSSVIDIGCGTGALAFKLSEKCKRVVGIELSLKMIQYANKQKEKGNYLNVEFIHADATKLSETMDQRFDYATTALVIHEMKVDDRVKTINEMKAIAEKIIIADYIAPQPKNLWGVSNVLTEIVAGIDHYRNFKSFITHKGIDNLLYSCGLNIEQDKIDKTGTFRIVKVSF